MRFSIAFFMFFLHLNAQIIPVCNPDSVRSIVACLGDDQLQGRASGSAGLEKAALYISGELKALGLKPKGQNNTWYQKVPMHGTLVDPRSTLQLYYDNFNQYLFYKKDFMLIKSGGEVYNPGLLPVVSVGYGIIAPEYGYNNYRDIDVTGKIVLCLDGEPFSDDSHFFDGKENTIFAFPESKIRTAISQGAAGSIIIYNPGEGEWDSWAKKRREFAFEEVTLPGRVTGHNALFLNPDKADLLLRGTGKSYYALKNESSRGAFRPFILKTKVAFNGILKQREFKSDNIVAVLEGRDPLLKDKYILIGAHYDHLGLGEPMDGDSVYNGVMDNAIGCAISLELARMFCLAEFRPRRSIIFAFFTGEEKGLLGSGYFTSHPSVDLADISAMINIDGLSAIGKFQSLIPVGGSYSDLGSVLQNVADEYGFETESIKISAYDLPFTKSDQLSFAQAGVPAIQVLEGYLYPDMSKSEALLKTQNWFNGYYHSPADDLKQNINFNSAGRYTNFMYLFINRLLNQADDPQWLQDSPYQRK